MHQLDLTWFPRLVSLVKKRTSLSLSEARKAYANLGPVDKADVNRIDYHNQPAEWIGTARMVHGKPGAAFGAPTDVTSSGVYWQEKRGGFPGWKADTQPQRKSLNATKAGTPPNPGRPELGGAVRDQ